MRVKGARTKIFNAVLAADVAKGHLKWKVSDIARSTGVSRPLIYYHFGKTKQAILAECLSVIATEFYGLSPTREPQRSETLLDSILRTRSMFLKNPALAVFYQKWRMQKSPLQTRLIEFESRYQAKLASAFPHLSNIRIVAIHGIFHGLITAPFIDKRSIEDAISVIHDAFAEENLKPSR